MTNLLEETLTIIKKYNKTSDDVKFVTDGEVDCSWETFREMANIEYDDGYGGAEINHSLKIVGKDWWLERGEYDGSEWWEFKTQPKKTKNGIPNIKEEI